MAVTPRQPFRRLTGVPKGRVDSGKVRPVRVVVPSLTPTTGVDGSPLTPSAVLFLDGMSRGGGHLWRKTEFPFVNDVDDFLEEYDLPLRLRPVAPLLDFETVGRVSDGGARGTVFIREGEDS